MLEKRTEGSRLAPIDLVEQVHSEQIVLQHPVGDSAQGIEGSTDRNCVTSERE